VGLTKSPSVTDDRVVSAKRALPRQSIQRNYPGSRLSFASGSAIKRIKAGVKARFRPSLPKFRSAKPSLHPPVKSVSNEKRIPPCLVGRQHLTHNFGRFKTTTQPSGSVNARASGGSSVNRPHIGRGRYLTGWVLFQTRRNSATSTILIKS